MKEPKRVNAETEKLEVKYCIPDWLREKQIEMSCSRFSKRIIPAKETTKEPIALVCFGPSLNETWEKIKDFKFVMSCSGSHKFLKEHGITPTYHVDVDPRAHKATLIGDDISKDTQFLMASCCHPDVFTHLEKRRADIILWHTYSGEGATKMPEIYPRGEWISTGGANVGLRAMVVARILGFTNIHVFGMDGSFPEGKTHASFHPNAPKSHIIAEFDGKDYCTTTSFLECARQTVKEIGMLPDTSITFYGDGLIQAMVKKNFKDKKEKCNIAFCMMPTISKAYIEQNRELHQRNPVYGISAIHHVDTIKKMYDKIEAKSLLDYGCGKGMLAKQLDFPIWEYDPAILGKDFPPRAADLVVCIDVLEHIEPEYLDSVLSDLARCTKKVGYFVIGTRAAIKTLSDGRNTHLIVQDKDWWKEKLSKYFVVPDNGIFDKGAEAYFVVSPKTHKAPVEEFTLIDTSLQESK